MQAIRKPFPTYLLVLLGGVIVAVLILLAIPKPRPADEAAWETVDVRAGAGARRGEPELPVGRWRISAIRRSSLGVHETRVQEVDGRRVLGSWGLAHTAPDGSTRLRARTSQARADAEHRRGLDAGEAIEIALTALDTDALRDDPDVEAAFVPDGFRLVPVWLVTVRCFDPLGDWQIAVDDAGDIRSVDNVLCIAAHANVFTARPQVPCGHGLLATDTDLAPSLVSTELHGLLVGGTLDGTRVRVTDSSGPRAYRPSGNFDYLPSDGEFEQVMCYETMTSTLSYIDDLGVNGYGAASFHADARGYSGDNSFFSPSTGQITFGIGGIPDAQDRDIINHELGHALHHYAQPEYASSPSSRAVSEGLSDYLAATRADDARIGDWDAEAYSTACLPYLRRLDVARRYPDDVSGRAHDDGLILATALWAIRDRIGTAVTDRIVLESLFFLTPDADLHSAAATIATTEELLTGGTYAADIQDVYSTWGLIDGVAPIGPEILVRATPNPFRSQSTIRYVLPRSGTVRVDIVDVQGRLVANLVRSPQPAGSHRVTWDGRVNGRTVPPGLYFYCVAVDASFTSGKILFAP